MTRNTNDNPLVSVIVPTYNSSATLDACLRSVRNQTYENFELIVIDNNSNDNTKEIAKHYTDRVYNKGPERSWQRNFGVEKSRGKYVAIIDSDMSLAPEVIEQSLRSIETDNVAGVIIPEASFGEGFWAQCKRLERSFYVGIDGIEAARFFTRNLYQELGGYNTAMVSGEDWDLSQRAEKYGKLARIDAFIMHDEGRISLGKTLKKKYYYAQHSLDYLTATDAVHGSPITAKQGPLQRYKLFFSQPDKLFRNPLLGCGMLFMKTAEYVCGGMAIIRAKRLKDRDHNL